jgi:hypothetical protein
MVSLSLSTLPLSLSTLSLSTTPFLTKKHSEELFLQEFLDIHLFQQKVDGVTVTVDVATVTVDVVTVDDAISCFFLTKKHSEELFLQEFLDIKTTILRSIVFALFLPVPVAARRNFMAHS